MTFTRGAFVTFLLLASCVACVGAAATTYFVDCAAGAGTACTSGAPCKTIAAAVGLAVDGDTVQVTGACAEHDITVTAAITISGPSATTPASMDCTGGRCFVLSPTTGVTTLQSLSLSNSFITTIGGCVQCTTACALFNVDATACVADTQGGAVGVDVNAQATIRGGTFSANGAPSGGALFGGTGATIVVSGATFSGNTATYGTAGRGGAIYFNTVLNVSRCTFVGNVGYFGAGIGTRAPLAVLAVDNSVFLGNTSTALPSNGGAGGGIAMLGDYFHMANTSISGHVTSSCAGGVVSTALDVYFDNVTMTRNSAVQGGGLYLLSSASGRSVVIKNSLIAYNSARAIGGGLFAGCNKFSAVLADTSFLHNTASDRALDSAAGLVVEDMPLRMSGSITIAGNVGQAYGAVVLIACYGEPLMVDAGVTAFVVADNICNGTGAGMFVAQSSFSLPNNTVFRNNSAGNGPTSFGGGLMLVDSSVTADYATFDGNLGLQGAAIAGVNSTVYMRSPRFVGNSADDASLVWASGVLNVSLSGALYACDNHARTGLLVGATTTFHTLQVPLPVVYSPGTVRMAIDGIPSGSLIECPGCPTPCGGAHAGKCNYTTGACTCLADYTLDPATMTCVSLYPDTPTALALDQATTTSFHAAWHAPAYAGSTAGGITAYVVTVSADSSMALPWPCAVCQADAVVALEATITTSNGAALAPATTYYARVQACNSVGCSAASEAVAVTTATAAVPNAIGAGVATTGTDSSTTNAIIGGVVGGAAGLALIIGLIVLVICTRRKGAAASNKKATSTVESASGTHSGAVALSESASVASRSNVSGESSA